MIDTTLVTPKDAGVELPLVSLPQRPQQPFFGERPGNPNNKAGNECYLNDQAFMFQATMDNGSGNVVEIKPQTINQMVIEDSIFNYGLKGYVTIVNNLEVLERSPGPTQESNLYYKFRMDGRDLLTLKLLPLTDGITRSKLPPEIWGIHSQCVIYDTEDIPGESVTEKTKRLYFWDYRYQKMQEYNIPFSTPLMVDNNRYPSSSSQSTLVSNPKTPDLRTDEENSMYTGEALYNLLTSIGFYADDFAPSIKTENGINSNAIDWDPGAGKIRYTSPAQSSVLDDFEYILKKHCSRDLKDVCLFMVDRWSDKPGGNKMRLVPISKIFERSTEKKTPGPWQLEHFFIADLGDDKLNPNAVSKFYAPYDNANSVERDIKMRDYNTILSYHFNDMSGIDSAKALITKPVCGYEFKTGEFVIDYKDHEIQTVRQFFTDNYVQKMKGNQGQPAPLFTLNPQRITGTNHMPEFSMGQSPETRMGAGRGEVLQSALFLNECITFKVKGMTHRTAGRFIAIDRLNSTTENTFDYKFLGQWFVTSVKHIITDGLYHNEIVAVKIHSHKPLRIEEG